ncbi:HAD family hydrolase [Telmatospirillum siberiense]|uniref:HAD family hydrolase n=2 Tax=Telmatospirillum siberiense TaxID=382514 RepID=A0A2N3PRZ5_9PROT|nr:HAD family hydrolase [Telmatospirillum siberiense]
MERFLADVCTPGWNDQMDAGRSWSEAIDELVARHPEQAENIRAFRGRWPEMLGGTIDETVGILETLHRKGTPLYALTNWSEDTFELTKSRFPFLNYFRGIVVSGRERLRKPDPEIFHRLLKRYDIAAPHHAVFIDDNAENIASAATLGFHAIRFLSATKLRSELQDLGFAV